MRRSRILPKQESTPNTMACNLKIAGNNRKNGRNEIMHPAKQCASAATRCCVYPAAKVRLGTTLPDPVMLGQTTANHSPSPDHPTLNFT